MDISEALREIQPITDSALSRLEPQALLDELVSRVRDALGVDTAAVLLLEASGSHLVAAATSGLEEEVPQGSRVPLGAGFVGRIATRIEPVIVSEVGHRNVGNPVLLAKGIRSLMRAPLLVEGQVIGVLHVGTLTHRDFTEHDLNLLQLTADRAALAVQALYGQLDRDATTALQRSLMPSALPTVCGLEIAARYVPGTGPVGGDWYDVFPLPSGEICAVIGDVTGSGLHAAVIMGRMRSALRAYALETSDPADILTRLDRKMRHFEPNALATVLCAVISPELDAMRISCAGHLPPVLCTADGDCVLAEITSDVLIGAPVGFDRHACTITWPPAAMFAMFTDGLVERRGEGIDEGLDRLCRALTPGDPESRCAEVMAALTDASSRSDDTALLLFRRSAIYTVNGQDPRDALDTTSGEVAVGSMRR
jgi:serine phosphatase RsbU (regulator of sigma subunit)